MEKGNKRDPTWLFFTMFATGVFLMGFHSDLAFWIAGGLGIVAGLILYFSKVVLR